MNFLINSVDLEKALKDLRPETTRADMDMLFQRIEGHKQLREALNVNINVGDCEVTYFKGASKLIGA